jgi:hypothetical protein
MDVLLKLLRKVETDETIKESEYYLDSKNDTINAISTNASILLLTDSGNRNSDNIQILLEAGYYVSPFGKDCPGWILGSILTTKGLIAYYHLEDNVFRNIQTI